MENGFLREVIKGWYLPTRPDEAPRGRLIYAAFWRLLARLLKGGRGTIGGRLGGAFRNNGRGGTPTRSSRRCLPPATACARPIRSTTDRRSRYRPAKHHLM